jgi:hypothetical protein
MTSFINTMYETPSDAQAKSIRAANVWLTAITMHERVRAARFNLRDAPKVLGAGS